MDPTRRPIAGKQPADGHADDQAFRVHHKQDSPTAPGVGAAGTAAEAGVLLGAEREKEAAPEPITDPLQAAADIEREEEERGEVKPVDFIPEPGDVVLPAR